MAATPGPIIGRMPPAGASHPMPDHRPPRPLPRRPRGARLLAVALAAALVLGGCATSRMPTPPAQALRTLIEAGDLAGADALIAASGSTLDARRALDVSIRAGDAGAVRHFLDRAGIDAELDPDGTTPLIRAVLDAPPASRVALVALLVEAGARTDLRDRYGRDALTYATTRNRSELVPLLDGSARQPPPPRLPAFATWLSPAPATETPPGVAAPAPLRAPAPLDAKASVGPRPLAGPPPAKSAAKSAANSSAKSAASRAVETDAATTLRRPEPPSPGLLLRRSPWLPDVPTDRAGDELAALRFHADGTADLLRHRPGTDRYDPMPGSYVAWRLDGPTLRLAIVGDAFSATCTGTTGPPVAGAAARAEPRAAAATRASTSSSSSSSPSRSATSATSSSTSASSAAAASSTASTPFARATAEAVETLALACEEVLPSTGARPRGWSLEYAHALLLERDPPPPPGGEPTGAALLALATGRGAAGDLEAPPTPAAPQLAVALRGTPAGAACRPGKGRPRAAAPQPRAFGDWHALDVRRLESAAPLSGRMCAQTLARDAALAACRDAAGPGGAASCRSVGGCPAGQASALAALPGVDAGWVACDPDPTTARRRALAACRADLGCDCQLVAIAGQNVNTIAGASCAVPTARRR
jgi:hypothetical protein